MKKTGTPKKPITAFFLFKEKEKEKGNKIGAKVAGDLWKKLSEAEKKPFVEAYKKQKEKYDKYLEEVKGIAPRSSSKKKEKPTSYKTSRVRAVCGKSKDIKQMSSSIYRGLGRALVSEIWRTF